ncbi:hypothetical protein POM88_017972 [Heracleum sosnowskyi]|uniref:Uncharacterized protein n=1 Tax=Heracleum sosnowskyi TaxID=360622 RepID=A0AAD8MYH1_9APIA|nr:hypothetical protein POM88_017972 [Heracleum sosnowskyi]
MAPKSQTAASSNPLVIPKETNFLTMPSDTEANPRYKCFVCFLNTSYLRQALIMNPPMYVDLLEAFWRTATCTVMAKEDETSFLEIHCTVGGKELQFGEKEVNETFGFKTENHDAEANDQEMVDFMTLIKYADTIEMAKLNKKNVRREWSYLFDALQKVFMCRKTGWDQISHIVVKLAYFLAYNQEINVGAIIIRELAQRLGKTPRGRGTEIFYPRFIQCILNHLDNKLHEVEGIDTSKLAYPKSMSKVIFGTLDTRNQVDVVLSVTKHMQDTFETYTLDKPIYHSLSWKGKAKTDGASESNPSLPNPSSKPFANTTLVIREPSAPTSQKVVVTKKKSKKIVIAITDDTVDLGSEEPESQLTRQRKKSKQIATTESSQHDSDVIKEVNLLLSMASQKVIGIEKSSLPTTTCKESAQSQELTLDSGEQQGGTTLSGDHITIETPPISQGELPKSNLNPTSLLESTNANISSLQESHSHDNPTFDHSFFNSVNEPLSSDIF